MASISETIDPSSSSNHGVDGSDGVQIPDNPQRDGTLPAKGARPSSFPLALQADRKPVMVRLHSETNVNPPPYEFTPGDDAAFIAIKLPRTENKKGVSGVNGTKGVRKFDNIQGHVNDTDLITGTRPYSLALAFEADRQTGAVRPLSETSLYLPPRDESTSGNYAAFTTTNLPRSGNQNGASGAQINPEMYFNMMGGGRRGAVQLKGGEEIQSESKGPLPEQEKRARHSAWTVDYDDDYGEISEY